MEEKQFPFNVSIIKAINYSALLLLGSAFFCYTIFGVDFAEMAVQRRGLDFPIFVGEILLTVLIIFSLLKSLLSPLKLNQTVSLALILFYIFILVKAFIGYFVWGPLALRNAALFYYSFFAFVGYFFFDSEILKRNYVKLTLLFILSFAAISKIVTTASSGYAYFILLIAIFITYKNRLVRFCGISWAIFLYLYMGSFNHTKALFVASGISLLYLLLMFYLLIGKKVKSRKTRVGFFVILLFSSSLIFSFFLKKIMLERIRNVVDIANFIEKYGKMNKPINFNAEKDSSRKDINISLYEVENPGLGNSWIGAYTYKVALDSDGIKSKQMEKPVLKDSYRPAKRSSFSREHKNKEPIIEDKDFIVGMDNNNMLWRAFVWQDALDELFSTNLLFGVNFGKPFRSKSIEALHWDYGYGRVGWIEPHNSYVHILYRGGLIGILFVFIIFTFFIRTSVIFFKSRNYVGILFNSIILHWLFFAFFNVFLELPYYAIPFWIFFGTVLALAYKRPI